MGLGTPKEVATATNAYRNRMYTIGLFLDESCVIHEDEKYLRVIYIVRTQYGQMKMENTP